MTPTFTQRLGLVCDGGKDLNSSLLFSSERKAMNASSSMTVWICASLSPDLRRPDYKDRQKTQTKLFIWKRLAYTSNHTCNVSFWYLPVFETLLRTHCRLCTAQRPYIGQGILFGLFLYHCLHFSYLSWPFPVLNLNSKNSLYLCSLLFLLFLTIIVCVCLRLSISLVAWKSGPASPQQVTTWQWTRTIAGRQTVYILLACRRDAAQSQLCDLQTRRALQ